MPPQQRTKSEADTQEAVEDEATPSMHQVMPLVEGEAQAPTLLQAFFVLCEAMGGELEDDMPAWTHVQEIQAWAVNAGDDASGKAQMTLAWAHAIQVLEGILGQSLTRR